MFLEIQGSLEFNEWRLILRVIYKLDLCCSVFVIKGFGIWIQGIYVVSWLVRVNNNFQISQKYCFNMKVV